MIAAAQTIQVTDVQIFVGYLAAAALFLFVAGGGADWVCDRLVPWLHRQLDRLADRRHITWWNDQADALADDIKAGRR